MSGNFIANSCRVVPLIPSGTGLTDMLTATGYTQLVGISCCNTSGSAVTIAINYLCAADSVSYKILTGYSIATAAAIWVPLEAFALATGDKIQVSNSTGSTVHFLLTLAEVPGRSG